MTKCDVCGNDTKEVTYVIEGWFITDAECTDDGCWWFKTVKETEERRKGEK